MPRFRPAIRGIHPRWVYQDGRCSRCRQSASCFQHGESHRFQASPHSSHAAIHPPYSWNCQQATTPSPTSTESLIGHTMADQAFSPAGPGRPTYPDFTTPGLHSQDHSFNAADLYDKLSTLLERGLATTAAKITGDIKSDLQNIGFRMESIENKLELTDAVSNQNTDLIQTFHYQLNTALSRIDDLENRSRRYNFTIRGLPETVTDVSAASQDLIKTLLPNMHQQRLELDRAHRALRPHRKDGSPR